jgi:hypothetical protein
MVWNDRKHNHALPRSRRPHKAAAQRPKAKGRSMKSTLAAFAVLAGAALSAPTPYPITIDSQSQAVPLVELYRANARTIRATFSDGGTASVITSQVPFFAWSTNLTSSTVVTANYEHVSGDTGKVDFSLAPADLNYTPGRYVYQAGLKTAAGNITVYRHGTLVIQGSPFATGAGTPTWTTNVNLALTTFVGTFPNANLDTNLQTLATPTPWRVFYSGAASNIVELPLGATNTVLTSSGVALAPTWAAGGGGSGDLTAVEVSGGLLTVASGTGPVPTVGLTTNAVRAAQTNVVDTDTTFTNRIDAGDSIAIAGGAQGGSNTISLLADVAFSNAVQAAQTNVMDTDTTYTAGTNIDLAGTTFNLDAAAQASDDLADSAAQPANYNVFTTSNRFNGRVTLQSGVYFDGGGGSGTAMFSPDGLTYFDMEDGSASIAATGDARVLFHQSILQDDGGVWKSEGTATTLLEIVNYQTCTGLISTLATGDNLGDHTAVSNLDMAVNNILRVDDIEGGHSVLAIENDHATSQSILLNTGIAGSAIQLNDNTSPAQKGSILVSLGDKTGAEFVLYDNAAAELMSVDTNGDMVVAGNLDVDDVTMGGLLSIEGLEISSIASGVVGTFGTSGTTRGMKFYQGADNSADAAAFQFLPIDAAKEITDTNGRQAIMSIKGEVAQSGTAAFDGLYIDADITSLGDGSTGDGNNLLAMATNGVAKFLVDLGGTIKITSQAAHPAAYAAGGQLYCVSNEVYAMDSAGNYSILSPDPDWAAGKRVVMLWGNIHSPDLEYVEAATLRGVLTGEIKPNPTNVITIPTPAHIRHDWDADEQGKRARRQEDIAAGMANTNSVQVKGPRPKPYTPRAKPKWVRDLEQGKRP